MWPHPLNSPTVGTALSSKSHEKLPLLFFGFLPLYISSAPRWPLTEAGEWSHPETLSTRPRPATRATSLWWVDVASTTRTPRPPQRSSGVKVFHQLQPVCKLWMTSLILCLLIAQGDQWTGVPDDLACRGRRQLLHVHLADGLRLQGLDASG